MPDDLQRIAAENQSSKDLQVAKLEGDLQDEKDCRKEERFILAVVILFLLNIIAVRDVSWTAFPILAFFDLLLILVLARSCEIGEIYTLIQNAIDYSRAFVTKQMSQKQDDSPKPSASNPSNDVTPDAPEPPKQ